MADEKREAPRYRTGKWHDKDNYECTRCPYATLDRGKILKHVQQDHPPRRARPAALLSGVDFASDEAAELAAELGLTAAVLGRKTPSGKNGYTVADVRAAAPTEEV